MWPGVISAICFALFFLGHYLAGLAGWEVVALFVLGMVLVLIEILFFAHSTIVFGVLGVFLIIASLDRKSTRLNSSHTVISYAVFCLKKKKKLSNLINYIL